MDSSAATEHIPLQLIQGCVVASIQVDLSDDVLRRFRDELLARIATERVHGVVLDVSGVEVMDSTDFEMLKTTMTMASVMGASSIIVGLRPGIVSALMDLNVSIDNVRAALNLDDALRQLNSPAVEVTPMEPEPERLADADGR